ncbi:hypothetical protein PAXRUDRAFT_22523, partial [Paxillus rubicundulus Ve08.2h10]
MWSGGVEEKRKAEEEAKRKAEAEAKVRAEEVVRAQQSSVAGPAKGKQPKAAASGAGRGSSPVLWVLGRQGGVRDEGGREQQGEVPSRRRKREEVMSPRAGKKKARTKSPTAEDGEAEENRDALGALAEVLSAMVGEMRNMAADRRHAAEESHAQMERVLGTLEEIQGYLDPEFVLEEEFEEEE